MALINNLPPQAYTRDVLVKAIEWISTQPQAVRERASSADLIVSYYLQAKRKIAAQLEAPVSGEAFKSDLKHLAEDLKQFEEPSAPPHQPNRSPSFGAPEAPAPGPMLHVAPREPVHAQVTPVHMHPAYVAHAPPPMPPPRPVPPQTHYQPHLPAQQQHPHPQAHLHPHPHEPAEQAMNHHHDPNDPLHASQHLHYHHHQAPPPQQAKGVTWTIDARSLTAAREIQQRFNLSSEAEAIRFLVTLGIERAKEMFR